MRWLVMGYHKNYKKELGIAENIRAYIQSRVLKKDLERAPFDRSAEMR